MIIDRAEIKSGAKLSIRNSKPNAILVTLVFLIITYVLQALTFKIMGYNANMEAALDAFASGNMNYNFAVDQRPMAPVLSLAIRIMTLMLNAGMTIYFLNISRMRAGSFGNLFDGFGIFFRVLWLQIIMTVFTFLWTLLFIIPGIVAAYRYRLALYLLLDNPDLSALECVTASKRLMRGRKGELFVLDLSFIGWWLLTLIPFVSLWVSPYTGVTYANYYNTLIRLENGGSSVGGGYIQGSSGGDNNGGGGNPPWEF